MNFEKRLVDIYRLFVREKAGTVLVADEPNAAANRAAMKIIPGIGIIIY